MGKLAAELWCIHTAQIGNRIATATRKKSQDEVCSLMRFYQILLIIWNQSGEDGACFPCPGIEGIEG